MEKVTTAIAQHHGVVVRDDLRVRNMTASAQGLWGNADKVEVAALLLESQARPKRSFKKKKTRGPLAVSLTALGRTMSNRQVTPPHHKSMDSYRMFAWQDARTMAALLNETYNAQEIHDIFRSLSAQQIAEYEQALQEAIGDLLEKTEGQRPAYLRKLAKDHPDNPHLPAFTLLLAVIAQVRVARMLDLRDRFRDVLAPGAGHRRTCANLYEFGTAVARLHQGSTEFPYDLNLCTPKGGRF